MKALIVEDDQDLRRQLCTQLSDKGYTVEECETGKDARCLPATVCGRDARTWKRRRRGV